MVGAFLTEQNKKADGLKTACLALGKRHQF